MPYFLQWDRRWANKPYGESNMILHGCAPTCMAMIVSGLNKDSSITPLTLAKHTGYTDKYGTSWEYFRDVSKLYDISVREIGTDKSIYINELKAGNPIVINVGIGDFTSAGHYIVLVGVDSDNMFIVNDPNSPNNSSEKWSFERLSYQIKNSWVYSKAR